MPVLRFFAAFALCGLASVAAGQNATATTAVIDTTAGRLTCRLLTSQRPVTTSAFIALAEGIRPWTEPDGTVVQGPLFYDGTRIDASSAGIATGVRNTRDQKPAGPGFAPENSPLVPFDTPGLLAMTIRDGKEGPSRFLVTDHANHELEGTAVVFGQCDDVSVKVVAQMRRDLQKTDNHPRLPAAINHVAIVQAGAPLPKPVLALAEDNVVPPLPATPLARAGRA